MSQVSVLINVAHHGADTTPHEQDEPQERTRLECMFRDHHEFIWRVLRRHGLSPEGAADATQQVYLVASERIGDIRYGCERSFLLGTALRLARATLRRERRWQLETDMDHHCCTDRAAEQQASEQQLLALADRALATLDPDLLTVFVLFELEGASMREIAELEQIPRGTVASRLRRARHAFRAAVARLERPTCQEVAS